MGTDDRCNARIERASILDHLPHIDGVGRGDDKHASASDVGLNQDGWVRGISGDGRDSVLSQAFDEFSFLIRYDEGNVMFGKTFANAPSDTAVSHEDDLSRQVFFVGGVRHLGQGIERPFQLPCECRTGAKPNQQRLYCSKQQRVDGDRDEGAGENQALSFNRKET